MVPCHEPRQGQWASDQGFIPAFVCCSAVPLRTSPKSGQCRSIVREQKSRGTTCFVNRCKCHAAGLRYLGSAHEAGLGVNEEKLKSSGILRNPSRRRSPRSPSYCPCSTTTLFIPMSVPRPNATGFLFHEKPDALLVSRSQAQDIVHMTSGSGSSVEATGAPRDLSRAQHPVSTPQNPRSKPRYAPYSIP